MKIAIVLNTSWNIYNFRKGLVQTLLNAGHDVLAIAPEDEYVPHLLEMGCDYYPVKMERKGANPFQDLRLTYRLYKIYKETQPDVILQYTIKPNIYGTFAALPLKKLVINNVCGLGTVFIREGFTSQIARKLYKFAFRFPKRIFFQNEDDLKLFVSRGLVQEKLTDLLPGSGIPLDKFSPRPFKRNQSFTFLLIARLLYDKGICEFIEAIKILRAKGIPARYQILGALNPDRNLGVSEGQLQSWINEGLVEYLGTTDNVAEVIASADCVVLPSYREGTPRALLEAAGMAKPLITTDTAGCRQTVDDQVNGYLCKLKDSEDLAEKMERMYQLDEESLRKMGQASRSKVEAEFDEKIVVDKYLRLINSYQILLERNIRKNEEITTKYQESYSSF